MLSDEAKRQIAEAKARHRGRQWMRGEAELLDSRFGAKSLGVINEITPGLEIWVNEDGRRVADDLVGGIVVATDPGWSSVTDDGEIVNHPAVFTCWDPLRRRVTRVSEPEINPASIAVPSTKTLVTVVRTFCADTCNHYKRDPWALDSGEADKIAWASRLTAVLMGER